jgi:PAS domain S-box-containing protein
MIIVILVLVLIIALLAGLLIRERSTAVSTQKTLTEHLVFREILEKLSKTFVNIAPEKVDGAIDEAIKMVCDRMDFDIATLWEWTGDEKRYLTITHLYRPLGGSPAPSEPNADDLFPWCISEFKAGRIIAVSTDELPPEAARDRELWEYYGIKSSASFPLSTGNEPFYGVLGFNVTREKRPWPPEVLKGLQLVAQIFANALVRKISDQALRESEERLSLASAAAGAGVWILDPQTQLFWGNSQVLELFGFPMGQLVSVDTFLAKVHPEERALVSDALQQTSAFNEDVQVEYRVVDPDGTIRWIASRGRRQLNPSGGIARVMGISFDITERKKAGAVAEEIQSTVTAIIESTKDLIWSVDCERFGLLTFNTALAEYFRQGVGVPITRGMNPDDMVGGTFTPEFAEKWRSFYERALRDGPYNEEYVVSSGQKTLLLSFTLLKRDGKVFGVSVFGKDMTERNQMAEKIAAASRKWQTTFDSIPDLVMILDREHRVLKANAAASSFLGIPPEMILGQYCHVLIHGKDYRSCPIKMVSETKKHEERTIYEEKWQKWLAISVDPILDENGNIERLVHTIKDITEQKKIEVEAINSRREMLRMERVLRMGELTASLAHELNQPLTSILNNSRAALRFLDAGALDEDELRDILNDIANDDKRAGDIIRSLRSMVKREEAEMTTIPINDVVRKVVSLFNSEAIIRGIRVDTCLTDDLPNVNIDIIQVQQVLTNLLMNAAESMVGDGRDRRISIRTGAGGGRSARVVVSDTGTGIEEKDIRKIFDPFFTTKRSGLGMGLSLSRSIIEAHGGRMGVENNADKGATFYFDLPAVEGE